MVDSNTSRLKVQVLQFMDVGIVMISFLLARLLWNSFGVDYMLKVEGLQIDGRVVELSHITSSLYLIVPFTPISLEQFGYYDRSGFQSRYRAFSRCVKAHMFIMVTFALCAILLKLTPHRPTLLIGFGISILLIWLREVLLSARRKHRDYKGVGRIRLLIAAKSELAQSWWNGLDEELRARFELVGQYSVGEKDLDELRAILSETSAERVVFLVSEVAFEKVTHAVEECEIQGVEVWLAADFVRARICQPTFSLLGKTPMLVLRSTPSLSWSLFAKDILDRVGAIILIILTSPLWLLAYIGVKIQSPGPVIYKQERAGRYGKPFRIWKFRTMIMDADKKLEELKEKQGNQMSGPVFKLDHDPRIFSFGKFMRKFSIDELPQLINVFKGEMSLVGPRPMAMYELPEIERSAHRRKLSVKPGITCIWQVSGRNSITDFDEWVQLDLKYIDNWSFWLDIKLLFLTIPAVLFAKGSK